jgi:RHS repeat-associated protein
MIAGKWFDLCIGIDIHLVIVPPSPSPVPLPHPFVGLVFDPAGLIVGAAISAGISLAAGSPFTGPVLVNSLPAATTGMQTTNKMTMPHIPTPPGVSFAKGLPENDGTIITGSKTVHFSGPNASRLGDLVMTCSEPVRLPSSTIIAIPMGLPVLVGGPPHLDIMAALLASLRSRWVSEQLHALFGAAEGSWTSKIICFFTGHPVDVASGMVMTSSVDFKLPGPIPFQLERTYYSRSDYDGPLGFGWRHTYDQSIVLEKKRIVLRAGDGRDVYFRPVKEGETTRNRSERMNLTWRGNSFLVESSDRLRYHFAPQGRADGSLPLTRIEDRNGNQVVLRYDSLGQLVEIIDSAARRLLFKNDLEGRLVAVNAPHPHQDSQRLEVLRYEYDRHGDLVAAYDVLDNPYRYAYKHHLLVQETNRNGLSFYFMYDGVDKDAWCVRTWGDGGIYDHVLTYDKAKHITVVEDSLGKTKTYYANQAGIVEKIVDAMGGVTTYEWTPWGQKKRETDPFGKSRKWERDDEGRITAHTDKSGNTVKVSYDRDGNVARLDLPDGNFISWAYDAQGNPLSITNASGLRQTFSHDARGRLLSMVNPLGRTRRYSYDARGQVIRWVVDDREAYECAYSPQGQLVRFAKVKGWWNEFAYDLKNRLLRLRDRSGIRSSYIYDAEGNITQTMDHLGYVTQYKYGGFNRIVERLDPAGFQLRYEYDTEACLLALTTQSGEQYRFAYDPLGRVVEEQTFDGVIRRYGYVDSPYVTSLEEISSERPGDGVPPETRLTAIERGPEGQVLAKILPDGDTQQFAYDPLGRIVEANTSKHTIALKYDSFGHLIEESQDGQAIRYQVDPVGKTLRRIAPWGQVVAYEYGEWDRLVKLTLEGIRGRPITVQFQYDSSGDLLRGSYAAGVTLTEAHGPDGRLLRQDLAGPRGGAAWSYHYFEGGRIAGIGDSLCGGQEFAYDSAGQLRQIRDEGGIAESFTFDPAGNITVAGGLHFDIAKGNRLQSRDGASYRYEGFGNLVQRPVTEGDRISYQHLYYNGQHQLIRVENDAGEVLAEYEYDAFGRRVKKIVPGREIRYFWEGTSLLAEEQGGARREYVFNDYTPLAEVSGGACFFYHADVRGTPRAVTDEHGAVVWGGRCQPWGNLESRRGAFPQPFALPGQYVDAETGLHYNTCRYYDPRDARFLTQDPIGLSGGKNLYQFTTDPLHARDPLGLLIDFLQRRGPFPPADWAGPMANEGVLNALERGHNVALVQLRDGTILDPYISSAAGHSEEQILRDIANGEFAASEVSRIYSVLSPCFGETPNCLGNLQEAFQNERIRFEFSYPWNQEGIPWQATRELREICGR